MITENLDFNSDISVYKELLYKRNIHVSEESIISALNHIEFESLNKRRPDIKEIPEDFNIRDNVN